MASEIERMNFFSQAPLIICFTKVIHYFLLSDGRPLRLQPIKRTWGKKVSFHFFKHDVYRLFFTLITVDFQCHRISNLSGANDRSQALFGCKFYTVNF